jgi:hypothetical protein
VTTNHSSEGEAFREEAASIAAPQLPADALVDVAEARGRQIVGESTSATSAT